MYAAQAVTPDKTVVTYCQTQSSRRAHLFRATPARLPAARRLRLLVERVGEPRRPSARTVERAGLRRERVARGGAMPYTPHVEQHFTGGLVVRDTVIGLSDGRAVRCALAAGLTGAVDSTALVATAGLAEIAAGSIAMGLGGYLAGKSDVEHSASERQREQLEIEEKPEVEAMEVMELLQSHGLTPEESAPGVAALRSRPQAWRDFMLRCD